MINIFKIKNKTDNLVTSDDAIFNRYKEISHIKSDDLYTKFATSINGLSSNEVKKRLLSDGPNIVVKESTHKWLYFLLSSFKDSFIIILFILAGINYFMADLLSALIIVAIALISALIRFYQDYTTYKFNQKLKSTIFSTAITIRDGTETNIKTENVVVGDIVKLNAGSLVPADVMIIESKDLFVNQSVFTGESVPIEKSSKVKNNADTCFTLNNILLMGSNVVSGTPISMVINTGFDTYLGDISTNLNIKKEPTNYEKGINGITKMLIGYMIVVSVVVFFLNWFIKDDFYNALFFALSVAVGITPSMLPMIVNVNLTKGCKTLAAKKTLVKNIQAIQNLGSMDTLCTDKTGTLTQDEIALQIYMNVDGEEDISILNYAYLNSYYSTGSKNIVDKAVLSYGSLHGVDKVLNHYEKIDEIPFDYQRKKLSVVVKKGEDVTLITKGALEEVIKSCTKVKIKDKIKDINDDIINNVNILARDLASQGMQVIALASKKEYPGVDVFDASYEKNMILIGFVAFLDPPKKDVKQVLSKLSAKGVRTKILTGDNQYATKSVTHLVGMNDSLILTGVDIDKMSDKELSEKVEEVDIFARLDPLQKERIVKTLKHNGHVVGYMGDGVNDALSLNIADVGISVNTATDIAKEASAILLLEKKLDIVYQGVVEGRKIYGNIVKYMKMALSDDFGDVFSIVVASIFLPFLPLLPIQMLMQDFIYDFSQIGIPYDDVDEEFLATPKKWDTKDLGKFMNVMGVVSSVTDIMAFLIFWYVLGYNSIDKASYFQTAWFVECLISEIIIIHFVRTSKKPFIESRANSKLTFLTGVSFVLTIITPLLLHKVESFHFEILPFNYYIYIILLTALYAVIVEFVKKIYIKINHQWL